MRVMSTSRQSYPSGVSEGCYGLPELTIDYSKGAISHLTASERDSRPYRSTPLERRFPWQGQILPWLELERV